MTLGVKYIFVMLLLAAGAFAQCSCGAGYECCNDVRNGYLCYNPREYECNTVVNAGVVVQAMCEKGFRTCYAPRAANGATGAFVRCYNPALYQCAVSFDGQTGDLCQITEKACGDRCFGGDHQCTDGVLCGATEKSCVFTNGTVRCYYPATHQCIDGVLCGADEGLCAFNNTRQCFKLAEHKCLTVSTPAGNVNILCGVNEGACNVDGDVQCYGKETHDCFAGKGLRGTDLLCAAGERACAGNQQPAPGEVLREFQCYNFANQTCGESQLCAAGELECSGRCYNPSVYVCDGGAICEVNSRLCGAIRTDGGYQCYDTRRYYCNNGVVLPN